eukprot:1224-Heterococcus_DN1.PRE.2
MSQPTKVLVVTAKAARDLKKVQRVSAGLCRVCKLRASVHDASDRACLQLHNLSAYSLKLARAKFA